MRFGKIREPTDQKALHPHLSESQYLTLELLLLLLQSFRQGSIPHPI